MKKEKIFEALKNRHPRFVITGMTEDRQLVIYDREKDDKVYVSADEFEAYVLGI